MKSTLGRRTLLSGAAGVAGAALLPKRALGVDALPKLPIAPVIAGSADAASVTADFIADQVATANDQFAPAGMSFEAASPVTLDAKFRELETRADRDALGASVIAHEISV